MGSITKELEGLDISQIPAGQQPKAMQEKSFDLSKEIDAELRQNQNLNLQEAKHTDKTENISIDKEINELEKQGVIRSNFGSRAPSTVLEQHPADKQSAFQKLGDVSGISSREQSKLAPDRLAVFEPSQQDSFVTGPNASKLIVSSDPEPKEVVEIVYEPAEVP